MPSFSKPVPNEETPVKLNIICLIETLKCGETSFEKFIVLLMDNRESLSYDDLRIVKKYIEKKYSSLLEEKDFLLVKSRIYMILQAYLDIQDMISDLFAG